MIEKENFKQYHQMISSVNGLNRLVLFLRKDEEKSRKLDQQKWSIFRLKDDLVKFVTKVLNASKNVPHHHHNNGATKKTSTV